MTTATDRRYTLPELLAMPWGAVVPGDSWGHLRPDIRRDVEVAEIWTTSGGPVVVIPADTGDLPPPDDEGDASARAWAFDYLTQHGPVRPIDLADVEEVSTRRAPLVACFHGQTASGDAVGSNWVDFEEEAGLVQYLLEEAEAVGLFDIVQVTSPDVDPMTEHSRDLSPRQLATLGAPAYLSLADGEDDALDVAGLVALDIDTTQEGCPVVVRLHPALRALINTMQDGGNL